MLIIGLGNPGKKYKKTRHNAGFIVLDELREKLEFPNFEFNKKFNAEISKKGNLTLIKPQTFMNLSGETVRQFIDFYKLTPADILVIHDDLDIEIGAYKISENSRSAGHNGVQNIIDNLGTQKFKRWRVGIEKVGGRQKRGNISGKDFALQDFTNDEYLQIKKTSGNLHLLLK